ncbi:MAG: Gfo/Idh/MocA family oxidoreductase, partial [Thermomicrobiales bacterium]
LLGKRPVIYSSIDELAGASNHVDAVIVTTSPDLLAPVGMAAFELGLHVMVEKPIALTVQQGVSLIEAATRANRTLAVAENYRRDPINRLARAMLDAGVLGPIHLFVQASSGSGEKIIITPWRHQKRSGGIVVDMGIHYADLLEYFVGPIRQVFGFNSIVDRQRVDDRGTWHDVDAEDLSVGVAQFENGAIGNWLINLAGRGDTFFSRTAYGTGGSLAIPHDRSGRSIGLSLRQNGRDVRVEPEDQLELVPEFRLDDVTARLFGGHRLDSYHLDYPDIDANLLAIEQADFAAAIVEGHAPEVDGPTGLRSLAISYGFLEAERLGRAMRVDDLITNFDTPYQRELST